MKSTNFCAFVSAALLAAGCGSGLSVPTGDAGARPAAGLGSFKARDFDGLSVVYLFEAKAGDKGAYYWVRGEKPGKRVGLYGLVLAGQFFLLNVKVDNVALDLRNPANSATLTQIGQAFNGAAGNMADPGHAAVVRQFAGALITWRPAAFRPDPLSSSGE